MKEGWEIKKLGEVCEFQNGFAFKSNLFTDSGLPILRISNIQDFGIDINNLVYFNESSYKENFDRFKVYPNDILIAMSGGTTGKLGINNTETIYYLNQRVGKFSPSNKLNRTFLYYFLQTKSEESLAIAGGAAQPNLSTEQIKKFIIPLPPLPEQQRIISILDEAFAAIDKAKANAELNLKNAWELYDCYLQEAFERKERDWIEISLADVCEISSKLIDPKMAEYQNNLHVGAGNIVSKKGTLIDLKTAQEEYLISGKFLFDERMVLYSKIRPYLMKVVNCNFSGLCSADIYPLLPFENKLLKDYLYHLLLSKDFTEYAIVGSQRAGMPKVNRQHIFSYTFYLPPVKKQEIIVSKLNELSAETQKLERIYQQKLQDLEELRKSILQKAFNGEL